MTTTFAKPNSRQKMITSFATPLVLDSPRHCGLPAIQLSHGKHLVGTAEDCTIRLNADDIQGHHALVLVNDHRTVVKALDPRTWVNEGPVTEMALRPGDRLSIGPLTFRVRAATQEELASFSPWNEEDLANTARINTIVASARPIEWRESDPIDLSPAVTTTTVTSHHQQSVDPPDSNQLFQDKSEIEPLHFLKRLDAQAASDKTHAESESFKRIPAVETTDIQEASSGSVPLVEVGDTAAQQSSHESLGKRLDEIQQKLNELQKPAAAEHGSQKEALFHSEMMLAERHQLDLEREELQRRADDLALQARLIEEQTACVAERQAEVERLQSQVAVENTRLAANTESARHKLEAEYARHLAHWQEWEASYQRSTSELNGQLQALELRRAAIQTESERLSGERSELRRLQAEQERERRGIAAERIQLTTDRAALQTLRAQLDTERQQQLAVTQQRETQVATERRALAAATEELQSKWQQFEQERTEFLAERTAEATRREDELREHFQLRERLEQNRLQFERDLVELNALRHNLDAERAAFDLDRAEVEVARQEMANVWDRLQQAEQALNQLSLEQTGLDHSPANQPAAEVSAEPLDVDWFMAPYKSLVTESSCLQRQDPQATTGQTGTHAATVTVTEMHDSRDSKTQPTEFKPEAAQQFSPTTASLNPAFTTPNLSNPVSHRFWEDYSELNGLGEPDSHRIGTAQHEAGMTCQTTSLSMLSGEQSTTANITRPASTLAEDTRRTDDMFLDYITQPWLHATESDLNYIASEMDEYNSATTSLLESEPSVGETLAEINREFGETDSTLDEEQHSKSQLQLPAWFVDTKPNQQAPTSFCTSEIDLESEQSVSDAYGESIDSVTTEASPALGTPAAVDNLTLSHLRLQLAEMFHIPLDTKEHADTNLDDAIDVVHTTEEALPPEKQSLESAEMVTSPTMARDLKSNGEHNTNLAIETSAEDEAARVTTVTHHDEDCAADDSVADYMEQLLARSRSQAAVAPTKAASSTSTSSSKKTMASASSQETTVPALVFDPNDRSHLDSEPKHKQDRQAVRDRIQSFRELAQRSARSALAHYSSKHLKTAVIAKSILFGVSLTAAASFLGGPLVGMQPLVWKGTGCALATLLSGIELYRSWSQLRQWKKLGELSKKGSSDANEIATSLRELKEKAEAESTDR